MPLIFELSVLSFCSCFYLSPNLALAEGFEPSVQVLEALNRPAVRQHYEKIMRET